MSQQKRAAILGFVKPGFEAVRQAFAENFVHRNELGAACSIYYHGEKVVDLWGGVRQLLSHQAELLALNAHVDRSVAADLARLAVTLALRDALHRSISHAM